MMTQRDKLLAKIQNNPRAVTFQQIETLLRQHGFQLVHVAGSHHQYQREGIHTVTIARHGSRVSEREVRIALAAVELARLREDD